MAWTTPRTYVAGELMTAAIGNTHWRDNLALLKTSISNDGLTWTGAINGTTGTFSGNVLAGAVLAGASATFKAMIDGTNSTGAMVVFNTDAANLSTQGTTPTSRLLVDSAAALQIQTSPNTAVGAARTWTTRLRLVENGDFGIGGAPSARLHVFATAATVGFYLQNANASAPAGIYNRFTAASPNNASQYFMYCEDSTAPRAIIYSHGGLHNYSANNANLSDLGAKLGTFERPQKGGALARIRRIEFYMDKYRDSKRAKPDLMWYAQQMAQVDSDFVTPWQVEERDADGKILKPALLGTRDHQVFMTNVLATQELAEIVDDHEARIKALEPAA